MSIPHLLCYPLYFVHTIAIGEITALDHELLDDSVESRSFITKTLFPCAQSTEVLGSLGDRFPIETDDDSAQFLIPVSDIEVDLRTAVNRPASRGEIRWNATLLVIFGPLAADEVCARNRKDAVKISSSEMTTRCRLAMLYIIDYGKGFDVQTMEYSGRTPVEISPIKLMLPPI